MQTLDLAILGVLGIKTTLISDSGQGIRQIIQTVPSMVSLYHVYDFQILKTYLQENLNLGHYLDCLNPHNISKRGLNSSLGLF